MILADVEHRCAEIKLVEELTQNIQYHLWNFTIFLTHSDYDLNFDEVLEETISWL